LRGLWDLGAGGGGGCWNLGMGGEVSGSYTTHGHSMPWMHVSDNATFSQEAQWLQSVKEATAQLDLDEEAEVSVRSNE